MRQDLRQTAVMEAEVLLRVAELRAEKIVDAGHRRSARLSEEVRELRQVRTRLASSLRGCIEAHIQMIERIEVDPEPEPTDASAVTYHPRSSTPAPIPFNSSSERD